MLSGPSVITLPAATSMTSPVYVSLNGLVPAGSIIIPGSEQLNRAYTRVTDSVFQQRAQLSSSSNPINILNSGEYYVPGFSSVSSGSAPPSTTLNSLYFSQADGGRVIKIDYTTADWNILHEDLVVDSSGYITLALTDPNITNIPDTPREPNTLTVGPAAKYGAMTGTGADVVMEFVDLSTGVTYNVVYNPAATTAQQYTLQADPMAQYYPQSLNAIDLSSAHQGRVRLGSSAINTSSPFSALSGRKFRVIYRARNDWTVQVYKPPSAFWQMSGLMSGSALNYTGTLDSLGWTGFYANANQLYLPAVYQGQSVAVDYVFQRELCRANNYAASGTTSLFVDNSIPVTPNMLLQIYTPFIPTGASISNPSYALANAANNGTITLSSPLKPAGQLRRIRLRV